MARVKISEFRAKTLVHNFLSIPYSGVPVRTDSKKQLPLSAIALASEDSLDPSKKYVIKVDQGIKKRFKQGFMKVDQTPEQVRSEIKRLEALGFNQFIVEDFVTYSPKQEN